MMLSTVDCGSNSAPSSGDSANVGNHFENKSERKDEFRAVNEQSYVYNYEDLHIRKGKWTVRFHWSENPFLLNSDKITYLIR